MCGLSAGGAPRPRPAFLPQARCSTAPWPRAPAGPSHPGRSGTGKCSPLAASGEVRTRGPGRGASGEEGGSRSRGVSPRARLVRPGPERLRSSPRVHPARRGPEAPRLRSRGRCAGGLPPGTLLRPCCPPGPPGREGRGAHTFPATCACTPSAARAARTGLDRGRRVEQSRAPAPGSWSFGRVPRHSTWGAGAAGARPATGSAAEPGLGRQSRLRLCISGLFFFFLFFFFLILFCP